MLSKCAGTAVMCLASCLYAVLANVCGRVAL